jgi:phenylacetate-coenzyme A ligase PaaK-like adenylate-forming protein
MEWHFGPNTGSIFWLEQAKRLDFDPRTDVRTVQDLEMFPNVVDELRNVRIEDLVPRGYRKDAGQPLIGESGGTTGPPKRVIWMPETLRQATDWHAAGLAAHGPIRQGGWLCMGPTEPHMAGTLIRETAARFGAVCFLLDLDLRWVKRCIERGAVDEVALYVEHVVDQGEWILRSQDIAVFYSTPPLPEALCQRDGLVEVINERTQIIGWGGTKMDTATRNRYQKEIFPGVTFVGGYASTMIIGGMVERAGSADPGEPAIFDPPSPFTIFVGLHSGDAGMRDNILSMLRDMHKAKRECNRVLKNRQSARLASIVAHARANSRYYREVYQSLPPRVEDVAMLPVTDKRTLMGRFDDWVTDNDVTLERARMFIDDPALVGTAFLDRYRLGTTSGVTGVRGIFVFDKPSRLVTSALALRAFGTWMPATDWAAVVAGGGRLAWVLATGGHFGSSTVLPQSRLRRGFADLQNGRLLRVFSVFSPMTELVDQINRFQPNVLVGYAGHLLLLAGEQEARRLRIAPRLVVLAAEGLTEAGYDRVARVFDARIGNGYGACEFMSTAIGCRSRWLHVNADWVVLEPVDRHYQPVPTGERSHTVLLTNLANRVQPVLRYDLGDSVVARAGPCPCGNPFPAIRVQGRASVLAVRNLSVAGGLPPTPCIPESAPSECSPSVAALLLVMSRLGDPISYAEEKQGALVQDVCPVPGEEAKQENTGAVYFKLHTENAFHASRPDFVGLLCLRAGHGRIAASITASINRAYPLLDPADIGILRQPRFRTRLAPSFCRGQAKRTYLPPGPVISGSPEHPQICVDFDDTCPCDESATRALGALEAALQQVKQESVLRPGELTIIDNAIAVHGRTSFRPRYDGADRWSQRLFVVRSVRSVLD